MTTPDRAAVGRTLCQTYKLRFGGFAIFYHLDVTPDGRIVHQQISTSGRHRNTDIGNMLDLVSALGNASTLDEVEAEIDKATARSAT